MSDLFNDLSQACDKLFSKAGMVITPADKPMLQEKIWQEMKVIGGWTLDEINIDLDDAAEFVDIQVVSGLKKESISLQWQDALGNFWVRVDTDGDGE